MREPLVLDQHQAGLSNEAACAIQALYMLELGSDSQLMDVARRIQRGADMMGVMLELGAYAHSINPVDPQLIQGKGGEKHLQYALSQILVREEAEAIPRIAPQMLDRLQETMKVRLGYARKHKGHYTRECRAGTVEDLKRATATGKIVAARHFFGALGLVLILPGKSGQECRMYNPADGTTQSMPLMWLEYYTERMYTVYGTTPYR